MHYEQKKSLYRLCIRNRNNNLSKRKARYYDKDVLIRIEDAPKIKREAREDIIVAIVELDIEGLHVANVPVDIKWKQEI